MKYRQVASIHQGQVTDAKSGAAIDPSNEPVAALGEALRRCYQDAIVEEVPEPLRELLQRLS